jgi:hypothetical protein
MPALGTEADTAAGVRIDTCVRLGRVDTRGAVPSRRRPCRGAAAPAPGGANPTPAASSARETTRLRWQTHWRRASGSDH